MNAETRRHRGRKEENAKLTSGRVTLEQSKRNVRIQLSPHADGKPQIGYGVKVIDTDTGEEIRHITNIDVYIPVNGIPYARITTLARLAECDIAAAASERETTKEMIARSFEESLKKAMASVGLRG